MWTVPLWLTCFQILSRIYINIFHFVAARKRGELPFRWESEDELRDHLKATRKFFPLEIAKTEKNPVLKWMLIEVHSGVNRDERKRLDAEAAMARKVAESAKKTSSE